MLYMPTEHRPSIQELTWKQVRQEFAQVNPELAAIIDELDPSSEYTLFRAKYPYGSEILQRSYLYIPDNRGGLVSLKSSQVPNSVKEKLSYNIFSNPVSLILKNTAELFIVLESNTIPLYGLIPPGKLFGTWRILNPTGNQNPIFIWDMTAGARSIFLLPKISETSGYNKLRKTFQLQADKPKNLLDHWKIFREIANHNSFDEHWETDILFFSKKWFDVMNDKKWKDFKIYLFEKSWQSSEYFRNQFMWDLAFSLIQRQRNFKPNPYISDTVKHLLAIGSGALPGFSAARDNVGGPVKNLQKVFVEVYKLTEYAPIIMQPHFFSLNEDRPVYYSLQYPTTLVFSPQSRENSTKIFNLYELKSLLNKYLSEVYSNNLNVSGTLTYSSKNEVRYDFFHTDVENHSGIRLSSEIAGEDVNFNKTFYGENQSFPSNSSFLRGCIKISKKNKVAAS